MTERSSPPPVLVITGMHRSGTSYAASLVNAAGLFLGDRLLGPSPSNTVGHFEDLEFLEFQMRLLSSHGVSEDGFVGDGSVNPERRFREDALRLAADRRGRGVPWGWKDPRSSLLLDFWHSVVPEARFLFLFRAPWDVVDSLYRRGDPVFAANPPFALRVWMHSNRLIRDFARRHPDRVLVREVTQLATAPAETLEAIRDRLGIPLGTAPATFRPELLTPAPAELAALVAGGMPACSELLAELRELAGGGPDRRGAGADAEADAGMLEGGLWAWQRIRDLERRETAVAETIRTEAARVAALETRAAVAERLAADREAMAAAVGSQLAAERGEHGRVMAERDSAIESLSGRLESGNREVERLTTAVCAGETRIRQLEEAVAAAAERVARADEAERDASARATAVESLSDRLAAESREVERLTAVLRAGEARIHELEQAVAAATGHLARVEEVERIAAERGVMVESLTERLLAHQTENERLATAIRAGESRVRELEGAVAQAGEHAERSLAEAGGLGRELDAARRAADHDAGRIAALEATIEDLRRSTSWQVTRPVRGVVRLVRGAKPAALARHWAFLAGRLGSPTAARRAATQAARILRADGVAGLVRRIAEARRHDDALAESSWQPGPPVVRLPLDAPRPLRPDPAPGPAPTTRPLVSVVVPVYETPAAVLEEMIRSVLDQTRRDWELVLVDDASAAAHVPEILARHAARDPRVRVHRREVNGGISAATNDGVTRAAGEYVAFLDHDDLLEPDALARCVEALATTGADAVYTDQDTVDDRGRAVWTFHKPDWSPEYLRHVMYVGHLLVVRRAVVDEVGGFRSEFDGVQDFEFMLRLGERTGKIAHIPEVLYHWRACAGSVASAPDAKRGIDALQARAVQAHLDRLGRPARAAAHPRLPHRCVVTPQLATFPRVSIVIPTKDRPELIGPCLDSLFAATRYPDVEVVAVDTGTTDPEAAEILRTRPVRVVRFDAPFNFSAANNLGAAAATGEVLVFLNNDTTVLSPDWLDHLVFHLAVADVGAVGPLLLYPDGSVQHAGVVLGARGTADHVMRGFPADADGYAGSLSCPREVSAVTGACLAIRRDALARIGGWNEMYATHYQDVDLCLRLRRAGLRCLFTPDARLTHHESPSRGDRYDFLDRLLLIDTWGDVISAGDPAYPAACSLERLDYSPRVEAADACPA